MFDRNIRTIEMTDLQLIVLTSEVFTHTVGTWEKKHVKINHKVACNLKIILVILVP